MAEVKDAARLAELEEAFALFTQASEHLSQSYAELQEKVVHLEKRLALSDSERRKVADRLERLLNLLPAGVIILNTQDEVSEMNPSALHILGEESLGEKWPSVLGRVFPTTNQAEELITKDKTYFHLSQVALDETLGKILLIQDVTSARQLQDHVNRHRRLQSMGEMAASLAHQIRTPLAAALLYVSQLAEADLPEDKQARFTSKAMQSLRHLEGLVKDMLQYAKGGSIGEFRINLADLFQNLEASVEQQLLESKSSLKIYPVADDIFIKGDNDSLLTALQNLISNAIDIVRFQAKIEIKAQPNKNWVTVLVKDYGPGISLEMQEKVFDPFFTSRAKGTGLGLAVVRTVVEAHGGEVLVKSDERSYTEFSLRLPLDKVDS